MHQHGNSVTKRPFWGGGGEAAILEEGHGNSQDELRAVAPPEDGLPGALHALQGLIGQHYGVKLHIHILGASHLL